MAIGKISITAEAESCLLCCDAPCSAACPHALDPAGMLRAVRFDNLYTAAAKIDPAVCADCSGDCERACLHYDRPVRIREVAKNLAPVTAGGKGADLSISFCGVKCENPFFLSSSVVSSNYEMCATALNMGWAGVVYKTIGFLTPKEVSPRFASTGRAGAPFDGFRNMEQISERPLETDLEDLRRLKQDFPSKVIVASIMGQSEEDWTALAKLCTEAGVDMIECNFSCPHMQGEGLGSDVGTNTTLVSLYTRAARRGTALPLLAKMTPNITNMEIPAIAAIDAGADGLAAINTIKSITGIRLDDMAPLPEVCGKSTVSGYSGRATKPIALRFIHDMAVHERLKGTPISGMGGIETWQDAAEFLALGCTNLQVTTAVMEYGYRVIDDLTEGLAAYLAESGCANVSEIVGSALSNIVPAEELDRDTVVFPVIDRDKCIGCGRCYVSCRDGGHQAIKFEYRTPQILGGKCVGCHLCMLVCPVSAISGSKRVLKSAK